MADMKQILRQYTRAKQERELFRALMTEVYKYAIPSRNTWSIQSEGERQDLEVFNSHPINSVKLFASKIVNLLAPVGLKFFELTLL